MRAFILACVLTAAAPTQPSSIPVAPAQIQTLVKQALENRLSANDIPDLNLLRSAARIAVRQDMRQARMTLTSDALPHLAGYTSYLVSSTDLQAEADRTEQDVFFVTVDRPSIDQDSATVWLGTGLVLPRTSHSLKLCCCVSQGQFHRDGAWRFVEWLQRICS